MMVFTKCARIEYHIEEFELEICNKKRWLIVAPFHNIFCRDPSSIPLPRSFHKERKWESFFLLKMHFTMRIHVLDSTEQARNFQLDNKELEKINVWPDQNCWLANFKSRKNKLIYFIFLLKKKKYIYIYIYINSIGYSLIILTIIYYFLLIISRQSHKGNMSQHCI